MRTPARFLVAIVLVMVAALCRLALMSVLGSDTPFLTYFPAVIVSSLVGGLGPGLLAAALSLLATVLLPSLDPTELAWTRPSAATLVMFTAVSVFVAWLGDRVRRQLLEGERAVRTAIAAEQHARGLLESIGDAFISVDRDWRIRYANGAALRFVTAPNGDLIGREWDPAWPLLGDRARATCRQAMTDRAALQFDDFNDALDRMLSVRAYPSADGGLSLHIADATEAHRATRAVADSERTLRVALRAGRLGTWHADADAGTVSCSPETLDILGLPAGDVTSDGLLTLVHPDDVAVVADARDRALHEGTECTVEFRACRPDGRVVWLEVRGQAVGDSGRRMTGVVLDATPRRRAEHERVAESMHARAVTFASARNGSAEAGTAIDAAPMAGTSAAPDWRDAPRDEFVSRLAHELRTPLNAILGWCEVLRMSADDPGQVGTAAEVIARNAREQARLIADISHTAPDDAGHAPPESPADGDGAAVPSHVPAATAPRLDGLTLLLLDDDEGSRAATHDVLVGAGAQVVVADRATAALALLERDPVDLIVSDLVLPETDGFEFIRRVRSSAPERGGAVPAIALAASAHADDRRRALLAGFQMHLVKPAAPAELLTAVQSLATLARAAGLGRA